MTTRKQRHAATVAKREQRIAEEKGQNLQLLANVQHHRQQKAYEAEQRAKRRGEALKKQLENFNSAEKIKSMAKAHDIIEENSNA